MAKSRVLSQEELKRMNGFDLAEYIVRELGLENKKKADGAFPEKPCFFAENIQTPSNTLLSSRDQQDPGKKAPTKKEG